MVNIPKKKTLLDRLPGQIAYFKRIRSLRRIRDKPRILVVEDQLFSRRLLFELIRGLYNVDVDLAGDAYEGLKSFLENAPDVAFLDIELVDESGHTLAQIIREIDPGAVLVMVTGNNSVEDVTLARANKVEDFIVKPYGKQKIRGALDKFIARFAAMKEKGSPDEQSR